MILVVEGFSKTTSVIFVEEDRISQKSIWSRLLPVQLITGIAVSRIVGHRPIFII